MMLGNLVGVTMWKNCMSLWDALVAQLVALSLPVGPSLLHLIYLNIQEPCFPGHLPKNSGEVIRPFLFKHGSVGVEVGLPGCFYHLRVLGEGLSASPRALAKGFCFLWVGSLGNVTGSLLFLPWFGHALVR